MKKRTRMGAVIEEQKTLKHEIGVSNQFHLMDLPIPVLHEILFRLPINSIMKVKLVCRALYELLSDPDFAVNYTKISTFATLVGTTNFCKDTCAFDNLDLVEVSDSHECIRTTFKTKIRGVSGFDLVGACNGLLCLSAWKWRTDVVYVCNPIMGEYMALPECKIEQNENSEYGFGFCTSTNNYKVLKIVWKPFPVYKEVEIFTIGIDETWRGLAIRKILFTNFLNNSVALNGAFHWFIMDNGSSRICTFDLGEEKLGQLSHPPGLLLNLYCMKLMSINNQLSLVDGLGSPVVAIWKMKEYAVAESWTKDMVLDISFISELQCRSLEPVTILQNGDMLFSHLSTDYLLLYNPIKRKVTQIRVGCHGIITCAPSFLSLKEALMGGHQSTMNL
ncbi:hypothetical protein BUALT_Bualt10G0073600 [Buddleja alternifolia]|uniref:F-box domain-containing protein n=1 Tax=Buddleja alternifolia TaxID=168488 RepID=A0AAV6X414_9LAMI|nr:hypothetical protein BUALT_Bualt10G0073600 [Buddleja alternifolia]